MPALTPEEALHRHFGLERFLPGQRQVIDAVLAGHSAAAIFPTGGGKSLCYQLPALLLSGVTVVVSPLIALMKDQIDSLRRRGIDAARLDSSLSLEEYRDVVDRLRSGQLRLLYVAPERFNNERFRAALAGCEISLMAIDEAHCISEWGHNFRPDYLKLAGYAHQFSVGRVLALTATATSRVLDDMCRGFTIASEHAVRTAFYRSNLTLLMGTTPTATRDQQLVSWLQERERGATIIYVTLQRTAERLAGVLRAAGLPAKHYHAGMKSEERTAVQEQFMKARDRIVVATIAFGMGIDKSDIRWIYHFNPPKSLENYAQEIGRAGRDGQPATCQLMLDAGDLHVLENFTYGDTPTRAAIDRLCQRLFTAVAVGETHELSLNELSRSTDIRSLVLRTLLTQLELQGYLQAGTPIYTKYELKPLVSSTVMLERFDEQRRQFVRGVLASSKKRKTWFSLDLEEAIRRTGGPRERVLRALDYLQGQELLELKVGQVRHRYHVLQLPEDLEALVAALHDRALGRERAEISRVHQVVELVRADSCQVSLLGAHFDQPLDTQCGHCTICLGQVGDAAAQPSPAQPTMNEAVWRELGELCATEGPEADALAAPRSRARFLCGVRSPWLSKAKLTRHELFGAFEEVPFQQVLERARAMDESR